MPSRLPPLSSLRAFEAAARLSSFKAAAQELAVTPAAISQQVRALEADLDVQLFERGARSVTLTPAGEEFARGVAEGFHRLRDAVARLKPAEADMLRITCSPPVAAKWLVPRLDCFSRRVEGARLAIESTFDVVDLGPSGPDIAIRFGRTPDPRLHAVHLCLEALVPLASPALVERLGLREPADIRRAPLIHDDSLRIFEGAPGWRDWFARTGLDPAEAERGTRFAGYADQAIEAAAGGAGVVLARRFLARDDIASGRLVMPFGPVIPLDLGYCILCEPKALRRPLVAAFLDWAQEEGQASEQIAPGGDVPGDIPPG
ncbi:MAG: LysR substrate-binding domain-containing protein [Pseudomonadota bacterium]